MTTIPRLDEAVPTASVEPSIPWDIRVQSWLDRLPWARLNRYFLFAYAPIAWLLLLILPTHPPGFSLDQCWAGILHYGAVHRWQFGTDAVFTYGPLGYLHCTAQYVPGTYLSCIIYQMVFKALFVGLLCRLGARLPRAEAVVFLLFNALLPMVDDDSIYLLLISYTGLLFCSRSTADRSWAFAALGFVAMAALIKGTFLLYGAAMLIWMTCYLLVNRRWPAAAGMLAVYGACFLGAYVWFAGQRPGSLLPYLRMSLEVIGGYSSAMTLPAPVEGLLGGSVIFALVLGRLGWLALGGADSPRQRLTLFLLLALGLFVAWKAGFTRSDYAHTPNFFVYALSIGTAGRIFFPPPAAPSSRRSFSPVEATALLVPALIYWTSCAQIYSGNHFPPTERIGANLGWLLDSEHQNERLDAAVQARAQLASLPESRAAVGRATVDDFGYTQSVLLANGFNYTPAPIFHGYNAYTPRLVAMNTAFYHSERAPAYVLFKPLPVDEHYPTLDNAGVLLGLLQDYRPVLTERSYLLLTRQRSAVQPAAPTAGLLAAGELHAGNRLMLPANVAAVWCELDLRPNLLGRALGTLCQAPVCTLNVFTRSNPVAQAYRVVPGMARAGFLLTPTVASGKDFVQAQTGHPSPDQQVVALTVTFEGAGGWLMRPEVGYRFYQLPPFAPADNGDAR